MPVFDVRAWDGALAALTSSGARSGSRTAASSRAAAEVPGTGRAPGDPDAPWFFVFDDGVLVARSRRRAGRPPDVAELRRFLDHRPRETLLVLEPGPVRTFAAAVVSVLSALYRPRRLDLIQARRRCGARAGHAGLEALVAGLLSR